MARQDTERLLKRKKLSLVLDLDHTLVHAMPVERMGFPQRGQELEVAITRFMKEYKFLKKFYFERRESFKVLAHSRKTNCDSGNLASLR